MFKQNIQDPKIDGYKVNSPTHLQKKKLYNRERKTKKRVQDTTIC